MRIESYSFGSMKVDGAEYTSDLIIFPDRVSSGWWRKEGHKLSMEDLEQVFEFKPEVLVVGKGSSGLMAIPASTETALREQGIELIAKNTGEAWPLFNEETAKGKKVVGAFHLTC